MSRLAGFYVPGAVSVIFGSPVGLGGVDVPIPGLPPGVGFPFVMTGRAAGEFVNADQNVDSVTLEVGADGEGVYVLSFDKSGILTVTVMKTSLMNVALTLAHDAMQDQISPLIFTIPVTVNDPNALGATSSMSNCVIQRKPPLVFGATEGENAWGLLTHDMAIKHGARVF